MTNAVAALLASAVLLSACGGAGAGGTPAPTGAGAEPKYYDRGKTAAPTGSSDGYYGY